MSHRWKGAAMVVMRRSDSGANLQRHRDCPADWCTCECHSLKTEEEEGRKKRSSRQAAHKKQVVSVRIQKRSQGFHPDICLLVSYRRGKKLLRDSNVTLLSLILTKS